MVVELTVCLGDDLVNRVIDIRTFGFGQEVVVMLYIDHNFDRVLLFGRAFLPDDKVELLDKTLVRDEFLSLLFDVKADRIGDFKLTPNNIDTHGKNSFGLEARIGAR